MTCRTTFVYGLASSEDGVIRYIGQTTRSLRVRLAGHMREARKTDTRRARWIRAVLAGGHKVVLRPLVTGARWNETEMALIALYRRRGFDLVNTTIGGQGVPGLCPEVRTKISVALMGHSVAAETRHALSRAGAKRMASAAERQRIAALTRRGMRRAEVREKLGKAPWTEDRRAARAALVRERFSSPQERAEQAERTGKLTPEQVREARNLREGGTPLADLCARFGIAKGPMSMLCRRITYRHVV